MVRTYIRKTDRGTVSTKVFEQAADRVINHNESLRKTASDFNVNFITLQKFVKKKQKRNAEPNGKKTDLKAGYLTPRQVFTETQEKLLADYIIKASKNFYGLSPKDIGQLAYQFANENKITAPLTWAATGMAGQTGLPNL
ncbi:uncharacterized protein LOC111086428 [Limulus polyphemus]|uniref:Uncharacterized protein LOC111086428 n=1 Tax=Limulus polyphemus TaxID=6850 RepID=A0ABM1SMS0_LIMPO|nr:uncharacterized protein LOC111086428 [Limulus polyphemus]